MREKRWAFMSKKVIGSQENPMLTRWRVLQTPWFGIYLHMIYREDLDRQPHDHPWQFWTWVIRGWYEEEFWADSSLVGVRGGRRHQARQRWSFRYFPQCACHRITAVHGKVTTLVVVGRKNRTWGFYDGAGNFIDWREYHAASNGWTNEQERLREEHRVAQFRGNDGRPMTTDPTYWRTPAHVQAMVEQLGPRDLGQRVAMENTEARRLLP